jgi:hypothetical protein
MWLRIGRRCIDVGRHQVDLGSGGRSVPFARALDYVPNFTRSDGFAYWVLAPKVLQL